MCPDSGQTIIELNPPHPSFLPGHRSVSCSVAPFLRGAVVYLHFFMLLKGDTLFMGDTVAKILSV